jgi:hypothetical protein
VRARKKIEADAQHNNRYIETEVAGVTHAGGPLIYIGAILLLILEVALDVREQLTHSKGSA